MTLILFAPKDRIRPIRAVLPTGQPADTCIRRFVRARANGTNHRIQWNDFRAPAFSL